MDFRRVGKKDAPDGSKLQTKKMRAPAYENWMIAILTITVNIVAMSIAFDFYYDLNDDVLMKDIMAGVYTGTPDGHNMQTLYLLGALIALCYRLCRSIPWYGLFLFLFQMGSLYLIGVRLLRFCRGRLAKAGVSVLITLFIWGVMLPHMVSLQYTLTCGMLAGTALFLFMTTKKGLTGRQFVMQNLPAVFLVILAYQLRSEMLLLLFPFICLSGLFRWLEEEKFFHKDNYYRYGIVIAAILAGMLISTLADSAAYGSKEWKAFRAFFDNRTQVYDFHMDIITSGEHKEYLRSIGLSDASQELLANYNFGLDEEIDENVLGEIAAYAADERIEPAEVMRQVKGYIYRTLAGGDAPYNRLVLGGYVCVALAGIYDAFLHKKCRGNWKFIWELVLLGLVRTIPWMYILIKGRDPERITHSLYFVETVLLSGMLCMRLLRPEEMRMSSSGRIETAAGKENAGKAGGFGCLVFAALSVLICLCYLPHNSASVHADKKNRENANLGAEAIAEYCKAHPDDFYFEDVYSTVGFSQKIFKNIDNSLTNYDIMGGWICKSPLYKEKLGQFGIVSMEDALIHDPDVYFILDITMPDGSTDWLRNYYAEKNIAIEINQIDRIADQYAVYQLHIR
ncbi:MAG: hypothetical protein NC434_03795 [Ruminococcus sp.]|nr:hypothetical protein [Ruminococcus sp.]